MRYMTVRDLRSSPARVWEALAEDDVVVLNNGRPQALMLAVDGDSVEQTARAVRKARLAEAVTRQRAAAREAGLDRLTMDDIDAEIAAARAERHVV